MQYRILFRQRIDDFLIHMRYLFSVMAMSFVRYLIGGVFYTYALFQMPVSRVVHFGRLNRLDYPADQYNKHTTTSPLLLLDCLRRADPGVYPSE